MAALNFHHLRYFWAVAHARNLTRAAAQLHVSQSAVSIQLRQLEDRLGHALFERRNRQLVLTEAGRIALEYADAIFRAGDELAQVLQGRERGERQPLRIGSAATLSRNFQLALLKPLLRRSDVRLAIHSGTLRELLAQLSAHSLDLVLSNVPVPREAGGALYSHLLAQQHASLVSRPPRSKGARQKRLRFPDDVRGQPLVLPGAGNALRIAFDALLARAEIQPQIVAEVDDMAMLRLIARESDALTLVPPVVVRDELKSGALIERCRIPALTESFYAISPSRRFPHPLVREAITRSLQSA